MIYRGAKSTVRLAVCLLKEMSDTEDSEVLETQEVRGYGASIWIDILIGKFRFQILVARILKNLSLHGVSIPPGSAGDGLKQLAPLFEPVYAALEERSVQAKWRQADETRWRR